MADIDSNHDGKLTAKDRTFGELKLGVDANSDGKTDADELHGLADFGVVEINLDFAKGSQVDNGNLLSMVSSWKASDGSTHDMADVWFAKGRARAAAPSAAELSAGPAADLVGGAAADVAAPKHRAAVAVPVMARARSLDDELLRHATPLIRRAADARTASEGAGKVGPRPGSFRAGLAFAVLPSQFLCVLTPAVRSPRSRRRPDVRFSPAVQHMDAATSR